MERYGKKHTELNAKSCANRLVISKTLGIVQLRYAGKMTKGWPRTATEFADTRNEVLSEQY
jgi:hypothetical protein